MRARLPWRGGAMGTRHAREWSGYFLFPALRVRGFLLLLDIFVYMKKITQVYFGNQLFLH
jgi:hypothetical protein